MKFTRSFALDDITIRSGDGRTVEAYAAVFDTPAEIHDRQGTYLERIARTAFDNTLAERGTSVGCFYNHARNLDGSPSESGSMPIGKPLEIRADSRGLFTVTQYAATPRVDELLELIRLGAITAQSFAGKFVASTPDRTRFSPDKTGNLTTVTRTQIDLTEYGPTPSPAYASAEIVGVRSQDLCAPARSTQARWLRRRFSA
jgi:HK97 family phage prohead protease